MKERRRVESRTLARQGGAPRRDAEPPRFPVPGRGLHRGARALFLFLGLGFWIACAGDDPVSAPGEAPLRLTLRAAGGEDPRTYSVGRVQLRALEGDEALASEIFEVDRATGVIDLAFAVPAGPDRILLVEPLGSAVLPNGGRTNSGVALQAVVRDLDVVADEVVEVEAVLEHFIPDDLLIGSLGEELDLVWRAMEIATSHRVRVLEIDAFADTLISRTVDVPAANGNRIRIDDLRGGKVIRGFQVQSVNEFAESAFSDTLFYTGP